MSYYNNISVLKGKTLVSVVDTGNDELIFECDDGTKYKMFHQQDCCESVYLAEIIGDLADLVGLVVEASEESNSDDSPDDDYTPDSYTWTFYKIGTTKGFVTLRWYGSSNGYYSESVDFIEISS